MSIETTADGKLRNYPLDENEFNKFQDKLTNMLTQEKCRIESQETFDVIGPEIKESALSLERLIDIGKAGLKLAPVKNEKGVVVSYQLETQAKKKYHFSCGSEDNRSSYLLNSKEGEPADSRTARHYLFKVPGSDAVLFRRNNARRRERVCAED